MLRLCHMTRTKAQIDTPCSAIGGKACLIDADKTLKKIDLWQIPLPQQPARFPVWQNAYASALFELAVSEKKIAAVENDLNRVGDLLKGSDDLMRLVKSPVFTADDQAAAIGAVLAKAKITGLVGNFIRVGSR